MGEYDLGEFEAPAPRGVRDPDFEGPAGKAWLVRVERGDERVRAEASANICAWVLWLPGVVDGKVKLGYSPLWHYYMLGVVHLREIRGTPEPKRRTPEMGYEMMLAAIDPQSHPGTIDPEKDWPLHHLEPLNFAEQWKDDLNDEQAAKIGEAAVRVLCRGILPPEGHRDIWSQSIATTVDHFRRGRH